jgi:group I intron endonuclease
MIVYSITNTKNGKRYVGQTIQTLAGRLNLHRKAAKRGVKTAIAAAIRKYGWHAFTAETLAICCTREGMDASEVYWIEQCNALAPNGYNLRTGGGEGYKLTEAFRATLRKPRGPFHSEAFKRERSQQFKGKPRSPETVAKIRATHRASPWATPRKFSATKAGNPKNIIPP